MYHYCFTLRKTAYPVWIVDYDNHIGKLIKKYPHMEIEYHFEDTAGLHIHGMLRTPKKVHVRQIHPGKGWNLDFDFIKSEQAWTAYMTKDTRNETNLINEEYRRYSQHELILQQNREFPDQMETEKSEETIENISPRVLYEHGFDIRSIEK